MWYLWDHGDLVDVYDNKEAADADCKWLVDDYYRMVFKRLTKTLIRQKIKVTEVRPRTAARYAGTEHRY